MARRPKGGGGGASAENGSTDSNGNLKTVCAAASTDKPGELAKTDSDRGKTDSNGNLMCKAYA